MAIFDLNDGSNFTLLDSGSGTGDAIDWGMPEPSLYKSSNPRTVGERVPISVYDKNRQIKVKLFWGRGASYTAWIAAIHNLITLCEGISQDYPAALQFQSTTGSTPYYFDVLRCWTNIKYEELLWGQLVEDNVTLTFECKPFVRGARQQLQNLCWNPGFESPSGPGVVVFNDPLYTTNAYTIQAGGPLGTDSLYYPDVVQADAPIRYYRFDEAAGTTAYDAMGSGYNGTLHGGVTLGATGALTGDSDKAYTFAAASSQYVDAATTGLPSGNAAFSLECWFKVAGAPVSGVFNLMQFGATGANNSFVVYMDTSARILVAPLSGGGSVLSAAVTTGAYHHLVTTWDGTTLRLYIDGVANGTPATPGAMALGTSFFYVGVENTGSLTNYYSGQIDEVAFYSTALSAARVNAHYTAGTVSPASSIFATSLMSYNPLRYYRMDEAAGTTMTDMMRSVNGTYSGAGVTYGVTGALSGDSDKAVTLASASSGNATAATTNLPTGNSAWTIGALVKFASNPGTAYSIVGFGAVGTKTEGYIYINSAGKAVVATNGGPTCTSTNNLSTGAYHFVVATWDGTSITLYVDGTATGTPSGAGPLNVGSTYFAIGVRNSTNYLNGQVDEVFIVGSALNATQIASLYAIAASTPTVNLGTMSLPSGCRISFGSPVWTSINTWQVRFRYTSSLTANFYIHYTDSNNYVVCQVTGTAISIIQNSAGTPSTLATASIQLVFETEYWLQFSLFPDAYNPSVTSANISYATLIQAKLLVDSGGSPGNTVSTIYNTITNSIGSVFLGKPQISASGATLAIGGNYANVHSVSQFGPGGWLYTQISGTEIAPGAWDQVYANAYQSGGVKSLKSARIDLPLVGVSTSQWVCGNATNLSTLSQTAIAPSASGDVLQFSGYYKTNGVSGTCVQSVIAYEYNSSATLVATTTLYTHTGSQSSWTQFTGSLTTSAGSSTRFVVLALQVLDSVNGASSGGSVWFENIQCWDQTATGATSMPYCELYFPQSPCQPFVTGLLGDIQSPALVNMGFGTGGTWNSGQNFYAYLGRRSNNSQILALVGQPTILASGSINPNLDPTAWSGWAPIVSQPLLTSAPMNTDQFGGQFEQMYRAKITGAATPSSVYVQGGIYIISTYSGAYQLSKVYPFSANSTWYIADLGTVSPQSIVGPGSMNNQSTTSLDQNITGSTNTTYSNFSVLLPCDTELFSGSVIASTGFSQVGFAMIYWDGNNGSISLFPGGSAYYNSYPQPTQTFQTNLNNATVYSTGSAYPVVDPTLNCGSVTGVNEFVSVAYDNNGLPVPFLMNIWYSPRYLMPK